MNPKIEVFQNGAVIKFHFDNLLTLRAALLGDRTHCTVFRGKRELKRLECECLTADAFADTLSEISRMPYVKNPSESYFN